MGRPFHQIVDPVAGQRPPEDAVPGDGAWQGVYTLLAADGTPVSVFASHASVGNDRSAALLLVPERHRMLLEHPATRKAAPAARRESDPLGLRDDALLRLAVDDYLPLATERVRDALDADASYLLIAHDVEDVFEVVAVSGLPDAVRGTPDGVRRRRRARRANAEPARGGRRWGRDGGRTVARHGRPIARHGAGGRRREGDRRAGGRLGAARGLQRRPVRPAAAAVGLAGARRGPGAAADLRTRASWLADVRRRGRRPARTLAGPGDDDGDHRPDRRAPARDLVRRLPRRRARRARAPAGLACRRTSGRGPAQRAAQDQAGGARGHRRRGAGG